MLRIEAVAAAAAVAGVAAVPPPTGVIGDAEHLVCSTSGTEFGLFCLRNCAIGPVSDSSTCQVDMEHNPHSSASIRIHLNTLGIG